MNVTVRDTNETSPLLEENSLQDVHQAHLESLQAPTSSEHMLGVPGFDDIIETIASFTGQDPKQVLDSIVREVLTNGLAQRYIWEFRTKNITSPTPILMRRSANFEWSSLQIFALSRVTNE
ncbi:hypothetical protein JCM33374_g1510 [Metschnikowia sp. JCM 33374]|nr:hypothetical protein JCM33374_g1510 [Metschnikowia sp. JCM 33374]